MTDVFNQSNRTYTSPSGVHVLPKQTTQLEDSDAKKLMEAYPRDLISPDSLRTAPASDAGQVELIGQLQTAIADLEENAKNFTAKLDQVTKRYQDEVVKTEDLTAQLTTLTNENAEFKAVIAEIDPEVMKAAIAAAEAKAKPAQ